MPQEPASRGDALGHTGDPAVKQNSTQEERWCEPPRSAVKSPGCRWETERAASGQRVPFTPDLWLPEPGSLLPACCLHHTFDVCPKSPVVRGEHSGNL